MNLGLSFSLTLDEMTTIASYQDLDEKPAAGLGAAVLVGIVLLTFVGIIGVALIVVLLAPTPLVAVAFWPRVQRAFEQYPGLRIAIASACAFTGLAFFFMRRRAPRVYGAFEIVFAVTLAWVALANKTAERLTIGTAILGSVYVAVRGAALISDSRHKAASNQITVNDWRDHIVFTRGETTIARIPNDLSNVAYKLDIDRLAERIKILEHTERGSA
jgi:hypothetical protein